MEPLPEHIADLIRQGRKLEAIKLIREETGVGLEEAKNAVDRLGAGAAPVPDPSLASDALPPEVEALARSGNKIAAIKLLRETTRVGLKEAKDRVDAVPGAPAVAPRGVALAVAVAILLSILGALAAFLFAAG